MDTDNKDIINTAFELKTIWRRNAIIWRIADYVLSLSAFIPSIVVVYLESKGSADNLNIIVASSIAAAMTLIIFAVNPKQQIRCHRKAWIELDIALHLYEWNPNNADIVKLILFCVISGEHTIDSIYDVDYSRNYFEVMRQIINGHEEEKHDA